MRIIPGCESECVGGKVGECGLMPDKRVKEAPYFSGNKQTKQVAKRRAGVSGRGARICLDAQNVHLFEAGWW